MLLVEKIWLMPYLQKTKLGSHLYVLFFVMISFLIFDAVSLKEAVQNMVGLFGIGVESWVSKESVYYLKQYLFLYVVAMIGSSELPKYCFLNLQEMKNLNN